MQIYSKQTEFHIDDNTAVAIGKFDGEHLGHRCLLGVLKDEAMKRNLKTAIFTFAIPPAKVIDTDDNNGQIMTNEERANRLSQEEIYYLIEYPFNDQIAAMSGEAFIRDILVGMMNMKLIVAGPDCAFGHNKSGNADLLRKLSSIYGYEVIIIDKQTDDLNREISSTLIKTELNCGRVEAANKMLGSNYTISGTVTSGNHIGGRILGFPTVNIVPANPKYLPRFGVYVTRVHIEGDKKAYYGMTNVGINPSVDNDIEEHKPRIETYIFDYDEDSYGKEVAIEFIHYIREEIKFTNLDELKKQIETDKKEVATYISQLL